MLSGPSQVPLILVVDDSITVRRDAAFAAARRFRVSLAADGLQALERLQEERPTVVLSDIEMPAWMASIWPGNIRADGALRDLPIIMITSRIAEKHREHAMELGVNHYLGKPYSDEAAEPDPALRTPGGRYRRGVKSRLPSAVFDSPKAPLRAMPVS